MRLDAVPDRIEGRVILGLPVEALPEPTQILLELGDGVRISIEQKPHRVDEVPVVVVLILGLERVHPVGRC